MKITPQLNTRAGSVLVVTLVLIGVMGLVLLSYLTMVGNQTKLNARSQTWNSCLVLAEAGNEDALAHLNKNGISTLGLFGGTTNNLISNGWTKDSQGIYMKREINDGYYQVNIILGSRPLITSTGYLLAPGTVTSTGGPFLAAAQMDKLPLWQSSKPFISRSIQATCRAIGRYNKAIVAKDKVELNGKYVIVDSYHSFDSTGSTYDPSNPTVPGLYNVAERRDHGDVAVISGFSDNLSIKAATVYGKVATGPDGDVKIDNKAKVGSKAWIDGGNTGVQPGWSTADANFDMPSVVKPFNTGLSPGGGVIGTNTYDFILLNGDYKMSQLNGKVYVGGNARLLVTAKINFKDGNSDDEGIDFAPGARLELYMEGQDAVLAGNKNKKNPTSLKRGFNTGGNTTNFFYFGTDKNTKLEISNADEFSGIIYAPKAAISIKAGSVKYYHMNVFGSIQGYSVKLEKNATFHNDETIGSLLADSYVVESWAEL